MSSSTNKQLQNNIINLFCNQQKLLTSANRKTQYIFSSLDALMLNSVNLSDCESQRNEKAKSNEKFAKRS